MGYREGEDWPERLHWSRTPLPPLPVSSSFWPRVLPIRVHFHPGLHRLVALRGPVHGIWPRLFYQCKNAPLIWINTAEVTPVSETRVVAARFFVSPEKVDMEVW